MSKEDKNFPKAVIFDWDNTLVDSWPLIHNAINVTMKEMNMDLWSLDKVKMNVHNSMRESFPSLFGDNWLKAGEIYKKAYRDQHLKKMKFLPDAINLISLLRKKDITLFIISNKIGDTLRMEVENLQISDHFFSVIGAGDAEFDKPHKSPVKLALQNSNLTPEKDLIWFIGDTITDIECAINSNCQPILYGLGSNVSKDLISKKSSIEIKPLLQFLHHKEIINYLGDINN